MSLKVLHKHIFAAKLRELLARSEILCVYQALSGDVSAAALAADANARLPPELGFRAEACRMRNAVAAATGDPLMQTLFHTSNVIVGFTPVEEEGAAAAGKGGAGAGAAAAAAATTAAPTTTAAATTARTAASTSIREMLSGLLPPANNGSPQPQQQQQQKPHLPQAAVAALLGAALELPSSSGGDRPLALLGAFYRRRPLPLRDMRAWRGLDAGHVHSGLIQALDAPAADTLAPLQALLDELAGPIDVEGSVGGVVAALEHKGSSGGGGEQAAAS
jgi:hypothetical protein